MTAQCHRILLACLVLAGTTTAQAGEIFVWGAPHFGYRSIHTDRQIPYFAEFPPVYYSYPVPRPYGYSPYAYLPNVMTPEVACAAEPLTIDNPYVPQSGETPQRPAADQTTATRQAPLVIDNPYFTQSASLAKLPAER